MDLHRGLIGFRGAEDIGFAHRNRRIAWNQHLHQTTDGFQSQGEGRDVIEHQIPQLAGEDAGLYGCADGHHLIGIDGLTGFPRHQGAHHFLHHRHAGGAAHQHHILNGIGAEIGIPQGLLHRPQQAVQQIRTERFKGAALEGGFDMEGPLGPGGDEG